MVAVGRLGVDDIPHEMVTELPPVFCWIGIGLVLLHEPNVPAPSECYSVKPRGWPSPFLCARNAAIRVLPFRAIKPPPFARTNSTIRNAICSAFCILGGANTSGLSVSCWESGLIRNGGTVGWARTTDLLFPQTAPKGRHGFAQLSITGGLPHAKAAKVSLDGSCRCVCVEVLCRAVLERSPYSLLLDARDLQ